MTDAKDVTGDARSAQLKEPRLPPRARLQLKRGISEKSAWMFTDEDVGARISLGASARCTWRIAAQHVAPVELYVVSSGDALHVKSVRPYQGVKLRGIPLGASWVRLDHGDVLEIGRARVEASFSSELADAKTQSTSHAQDNSAGEAGNRSWVATTASTLVSTAWSSLLKRL